MTFCPPYWISRYEYRLPLKKLRLLKNLEENPVLLASCSPVGRTALVVVVVEVQIKRSDLVQSGTTCEENQRQA